MVITNVIDSINLLADSMNSFTDNCLIGIKPNKKRINELM